MSKASFTPGPWVVTSSGDVFKRGEMMIAELQGYDADEKVFRLANANLIAAAPDMYEALEYIRKILSDHANMDAKESDTSPDDSRAYENGLCCQMIDKVIAKARGEKQ